MKRKYEGKLVGILGTIIIHLIGAIIFMSVKLSSVYHEKSSEFLVEFQPETKFVEDEVVEVPKTLEQLFAEDDRYRDIIRNISNPPDVNIDPEEYVDRVKEELIASGLLGEDNFIDEQKNHVEEMDSGDTAMEKSEEEKDDENVTSNELASLYQGPTRIYYELPGRHHLRLPIPIYKCEGSGIVVLNILVNQRGDVVEFRIDPSASTTADQCLVDAATEAVRNTRFNPDDSADTRQPGTITFHFVAQ
ncbi:MAG: TonB family protein [Bacteroidales bacterium]